MRVPPLVGLATLAFVVSSCGGGPRARVATALEAEDLAGALAAYDEARAHDGDDERLLAQVAELLLLGAARAEDDGAASAAVQQLALAGTRGRHALELLAREAHPHSLEALVALARVGDRDARRLLRGLADSDDEVVRAAAMLGTHVDTDRDELGGWCGDPAAAVRREACVRLAELAPDPAVLALLSERVRTDPSPSVRAAIARALAAFGTAAVPALRDRLSDAEASVRSAALDALVAADREAGREAVASMLELPTDVVTIDAARALATPSPRVTPTDDDRRRAAAHLTGALGHRDPNVRLAAALALVATGLAEHGEGATLEQLGALLASEPDVGVRLALGRALLPRRASDAEPALRRLLTEDHAMTGLQAAVLLGARGDADATDRVRAELHAADPALRRVAARALARDLMHPAEVRSAFDDEDPRVRIQAAGGVLAADAARE